MINYTQTLFPEENLKGELLDIQNDLYQTYHRKLFFLDTPFMTMDIGYYYNTACAICDDRIEFAFYRVDKEEEYLHSFHILLEHDYKEILKNLYPFKNELYERIGEEKSLALMNYTQIKASQERVLLVTDLLPIEYINSIKSRLLNKFVYFEKYGLVYIFDIRFLDGFMFLAFYNTEQCNVDVIKILFYDIEDYIGQLPLVDNSQINDLEDFYTFFDENISHMKNIIKDEDLRESVSKYTNQ